MKKTVIVFIVAALILVITGLWFFLLEPDMNLKGKMPFGIIILLVGLALFVGFKRIINARRGEPAEDELSKKILKKASSTAYYISLYMWLAVSYFSDKTTLETHTIISMGILGMAVIFCFCWIVFNFRGLTNE